MSPELVAQMSLDKSFAFYKDRFADASDFTFVFVGSFDVATIKPLVERYLGSLPALHRKEAPRDVGMPRPPVVEKQVTKGREPEPGRRRVHGDLPQRPAAAPDPARAWPIRSEEACSACCAKTWVAPTV